jgi:phage shock protein A
MTWAEYCERIGESQRSVDRILNDIGPIVDDFSAKLADTLGLPFNKIRMLGKKVGEGFGKLAENELIINDEIIPLTPDNKDEIVAAIDSLVDTHKKEQKELKAKLDRATKETDKIVDEATKGLTLERDALIKEVGRLKPFDPSGEDVSWSKEHMEKIHELTGELAVKCRQFIMDDRLKEREHRQLQAQVEMYLQQAEFALQDLRADWMDKFVTE